MALYACINCGNKVSSEGVNCPKCGFSIAKTVNETEKTKAEQQLRKRQLDYIEKEILDNQSAIENLLKSYEEASVLSKMSAAITAWEEHLRKKTENYPDAEKVLDAIQKRFPVEYEEIKKEVDAELLNKTAIFTNDKRDESGKCPECGTTYSANLIECPSCGWTENHKLAEEFRRVEQERTRMLLKRLSKMILDECRKIPQLASLDSCEAAPELLQSKRESIARDVSLMKSLLNEISASSDFSVLDYVGKTFRGKDVSIQITFYPCGYVCYKGSYYGLLKEELSEVLHAKERHISWTSYWEDWADGYRTEYSFHCSYQEAIAIITLLSIKYGYSFEKQEEIRMDYLNGLRISGGILEECFLDVENVVLPDSVKYIYSNAFALSKNLKRIVLSNALEDICSHQFSQCVNLSEVVIFPSVNKIDDSAFNGCEKVKFIIIEENRKTSVESQIYAKAHGIPYERLTLSEYSARREEDERIEAKLKAEEEARKRLEEERAETRRLLQVRKEELDREIAAIIKKNEKIRHDAQNVPAAREYEEKRREYAKVEQELNGLGIFGFMKKKELRQKLELLDREMERLRSEEPKQREALLATIIDSLPDKEKERSELEQAIEALKRQGELDAGSSEEKTSKEESSTKFEASKKDGLILDEDRLTEGVHEENSRQLLSSESEFGIHQGRLSHYEDKAGRESVTIPRGVTIIGAGVFRDCKNLKSIIIPDSVTHIEECVFSGCENLKRIVIPGSVASTGCDAFKDCTSLESVVICEGVLSVDSSAFSGCKKLKNITLPSSVIRIGPHAFENCKKLESIAIPDGVEEFGEGAFKDCTSLESVVICEGVLSVDKSAFSGCKNLKNITIPNSVIRIGWGAFMDCKSLESIVVPNGVEIMEDYAFSGCEKLKNFVIPSGVTTIESNIFKECISLERIVIPKGVKSVGWRAFSGCKKLKHIDIPSSVTDISYSVFEGCEKLVIRVRADSYAHTYMKENHNDFEEIGGARTSKSFRVRKKDPQPTFKYETTYQNTCHDEFRSSYDYIGGLKTQEEAVQFAMERMERGEYD